MSNPSNELLYTIALNSIKGVGAVMAKNLIAYCGSAEQVFNTSKHKLGKIPMMGTERADWVANADVLKEAEAELKFIEKNSITPLVFTQPEFPKRLRDCSDSPILLYYKGNADLNTAKTVGIVGTRRATDYGKELTKKLVADLATHDVLIVSGLAYGIDIAAHQAALDNQLKTLGVVAHGLNLIYPAQHSNTAKKMESQGGILTEYNSTHEMHPSNFPMRNRIVAGLCDAMVVVESKEEGGALITASLASSYNRDVFAFPGRTIDKSSMGCNKLIKQNKAAMIENANDLLEAMNWNMDPNKKPKPQRQLFLTLSDDENVIHQLLSEKEEMEIDELAFKSNFSSGALAGILLEMEMNGVIVMLPGKRYKLI